MDGWILLFPFPLAFNFCKTAKINMQIVKKEQTTVSSKLLPDVTAGRLSVSPLNVILTLFQVLIYFSKLWGYANARLHRLSTPRLMDSTCESLEGHVVGGAAEPNRGRCALTCNGDERDPSPPACQLPSPRNLLRQFYLVALIFRNHRAGVTHAASRHSQNKLQRKYFRLTVKCVTASVRVRPRACACI